MNDDDLNLNMSTSIYSYTSDDTIVISADDVTAVKASATPWYSNTKPMFGDFLERGAVPVSDASTVYDLDIDPLAAIIEIRAGGRFPEVDLIKRHIPSEESNRYAQTIRDFFLDKIVTQKLSSTYHDTDFKRDMVKALKLSAKNVLEEPHIKLLYRLPDFYEEDTFIDALVANNKSFPGTKGPGDIKNGTLSYIGAVDFYRRGQRNKNFYFKNSDNIVFMISSTKAANLLPVTKIFDKIETMIVSGAATYTKIKGYDFVIATLLHNYTVDDFTF